MRYVVFEGQEQHILADGMMAPAFQSERRDAPIRWRSPVEHVIPAKQNSDLLSHWI